MTVILSEYTLSRFFCKLIHQQYGLKRTQVIMIPSLAVEVDFFLRMYRLGETAGESFVG